MSEGDGPLWAGRFSERPAPEAEALGRSLGVDARLAPQDVVASIAHVEALLEAGLVTPAEADRLRLALREVGEEIAAGTFAFHSADEDVHSAIERGVIDRLGELGANLHAGRSRNDLVMADMRLWLLAARGRIDEGLVKLIDALVAHARTHAETVIPGSTHTRHAQPVTLGHHLLAHAWALLRDLERFEQWTTRAAVSPLGAGAIATSTLGLDPIVTAARLGFDHAFDNSIDAVSDRDVVQEFLAAAAICGTHTSRLAADVMRFSDEALRWASLPDAYSTGSSMMPNKRNPDIAELARAKAGRLLGNFAAVTSTLQGLPLGYHRDLQEDKEPVFDSADTLDLVLAALAGCIETLTFHADAMRASIGAGELLATDLVDEMVRGGAPFREAHRLVGETLLRVEKERRTLRDLTPDEWDELGVSDGEALLDADRSVRARSCPGGPSPTSVLAQVEAIERALSSRGHERVAASSPQT